MGAPLSEIALIAAVARNGAIGRDNQLLFVEPADRRHFKQLTLGCPVIMGRKTWDSLPAKVRPLPGRRNLVLSRDPAFTAEGAEVCADLPNALARVAAEARAFVIGGAQLYALALPLVQRLLLTEIDADLPGDTHFPAWDRSQFDEVSRQSQRSMTGMAYDFVEYRRR